MNTIQVNLTTGKLIGLCRDDWFVPSAWWCMTIADGRRCNTPQVETIRDLMLAGF